MLYVFEYTIIHVKLCDPNEYLHVVPVFKHAYRAFAHRGKHRATCRPARGLLSQIGHRLSKNAASPPEAPDFFSSACRSLFRASISCRPDFFLGRAFVRDALCGFAEGAEGVENCEGTCGGGVDTGEQLRGVLCAETTDGAREGVDAALPLIEPDRDLGSLGTRAALAGVFVGTSVSCSSAAFLLTLGKNGVFALSRGTSSSWPQTLQTRRSLRENDTAGRALLAPGARFVLRMVLTVPMPSRR